MEGRQRAAMSCPEVSSPDVNKALFSEQTAPDAKILSIMFDMMTSAEMKKSTSFIAIKGGDLVHQKMGLPNPFGECTSCGGSSIKQCDGHVGMIKLPQTIYHPFFIKEIAQLLNQTCLICKSPRQGMREKIRCKTSSKQIPLDDQPSCKFCSRKIYSKKWKFKVLKEKSSREIYAEIKTRDPKVGVVPDVMNVMLSPSEVFELLKGIDLEFIERHVTRRELLFLSCIAVPPNCCRVTEMPANDSSPKVAFDERTKAYRRLVNSKNGIDEKKELAEVSHMVLDCLSLSKLHPRKSPSRATSGLKWVKDVVLSKRTDNVSRMTVVGDPNVRLSELGVPESISKHLSIPESVTCYNKHIWDARIKELKVMEIKIRRNSILCSLADIDHFQIGDVLLRPLKDGDILLVNRPPSVHQHSLIALSARILPTTSVFSMNPLCCAPLCGDFDGDCLHTYFPQSIHSRVELKELVHLNKQLFNGQDSRSLISLSQDSLTAAHLITGGMVFLSKTEFQQLLMPPKQSLPVPAILKAPLLTGPLWTGQQLFSAIIPGNLEFSLPSVITSKGELLVSPAQSSWLENTADGLFSKISKCYGERALDYFSSAQEILCEWMSMRGLSVSLGDMYVSSNAYERKKLIQEVEECLREAERACRVNNLLSNADFVQCLKYCNGIKEISGSVDAETQSLLCCKDKIMNLKSFAAFKEVFDELQYLVRDFSSKSNPMLSMIHAGSKGNLSKFLQQSACLGLQYSATSFELPRRLSLANVNRYMVSLDASDPNVKCGSCAIIRSSFIDGLNPLEFFLHSSSARGNLFSENAEFPGTLTRKLMFYMRDLKVENDRTVRNSYGQQILKFSCDGPLEEPTQNAYSEIVNQGGHPIGALAACSISEAAYSALELPSYNADASPISCLKKAFECGQKRTASGQTISLALTPKLKRWDYGHEYAALSVQKHLERVFFSDLVSTVLIFYAGEDVKEGESPWITHFHVNKERVLKKGLNVKTIGDALLMEYRLFAEKSSAIYPALHISGRYCLHDGLNKEQPMENCVTVTAEKSKLPVDLDYIRNTLIPVLLRIVVRGYVEVQKVDIKWDDQRSCTLDGDSSGLFLKVVFSESCKAGTGWNFLMQACLPMMDLIDWNRSHPDNIFDAFKAFGVDAAWKCFVTNLKAATLKIRKRVHMEHLHLVADCLSATGQFHPLTSEGLNMQRDQQSLSSPFMQAFFSCPEKNFIKAAKKGEVDHLLGAVDAMAWGKEPPLGTGGPFKLMWKVPDLRGQESVYQNLRKEFPAMQKRHEAEFGDDPVGSHGQEERVLCNGFVRCGAIPEPNGLKTSLQTILHKYRKGACLKGKDKSIVAEALEFHPNRDAKVGVGIQDIKIGHSPRFPRSRCFIAQRTDGTSEDFSYLKCVKGAAERYYDTSSPVTYSGKNKRQKCAYP